MIWGGGYLGQNWGYDYLTKWGIDISFYCDSDANKWGTVINDRIVLSPTELESRKEDVFVFIIVGNQASHEVSDTLEKMGVVNRITYTELLGMKDVLYDYYPFMQEPRIAVYTCLINDYDEVIEHKYVSEQWDLFVLTDNTNKNYGRAKCLDIKEYLPSEITDFTRQNRFCKLHPHLIFPDYRYSIYYDANTFFVSDISEVVDSLPKTRMAVASRLFIDDIYEESLRLINAKRDNAEVISEQMKQYWLQGMPSHFGQYWNYVLVREHNNPICVNLMEEWWNEMEKYSKRDQLSLPYIIWKNGYSFEDVGIIDGVGKYWQRAQAHKRGESRV